MNSILMTEYAATTLIALLLAALTAAYRIRVKGREKLRFTRVEQQESSLLLSKSIMEMVYWGAQPFARSLVRLKVSADQISWTSLALGAVAASQLAVGNFGIGAFVSFLSSLLDLLDGLVARSTGTASESGEVLDATVDRYNEFFFLGSLAWYYRWNPAALGLAIAALGGSFMVSYSTAKAEAMSLIIPAGSARSLMRRPERAGYLVIGAGLSPVSISWIEPIRNSLPPSAYPMLIALTLVAVAGNISAIARLSWVARHASRRPG